MKKVLRPNEGADTISGLNAYQDLLSVGLIATSREDFVTCVETQNLRAAREMASRGGFDFVPVARGDEIVAVLNMQATSEVAGEELVRDFCDPLSERYLVGADTSILDFIVQADEYPFRLLVTNHGIGGLVSISDIQQLASRAALFALVTQLEILMARVIRRFSPGVVWSNLLSFERLERATSLWEAAQKSSRQVDLLTYTQFCDKATVLASPEMLKIFDISKTQFMKTFERFRRLRDDLAHANEIDASGKICNTVKAMQNWAVKLEAILR